MSLSKPNCRHSQGEWYVSISRWEEFASRTFNISARTKCDVVTVDPLGRHRRCEDPQWLFLDRQKDQSPEGPRRRQDGHNKGQSEDSDAYDLILKDKERLLSFADPTRFIFSHSACRRISV